MQVRILFVEDEDELRTKTAQMLKILSLDVVEAKDGIEALDLIKKEKFDIVISDIKMPRMNGYELLRQIRSLPEREDISFIFLTSNIEREQIRKGMDQGADDYITKPFSITELANSIKARLEKKKKLETIFLEKLNKITSDVNKKVYINEKSKLPNFFSLNDRLDLLASKEKRTYYLYDIHIDGEYEIENFFSESSKEKFMTTLVDKLNNIIEMGEELYHLGGFEFVILSSVNREQNINEIENKCNQISHIIEEPIVSKEVEFNLTASIGVAIESSDKESFKEIYKNAKTAKIFVQNLGGRGFKIFSPVVKNKVMEILSSNLKETISIKQKQAIEDEKERNKEVFETKIFFLYPQNILQKNLIKEIVKNEYAAYAIEDHNVMFKLLKKYNNSILFINIEAVLSQPEWEKYIKEIHSHPDIKNVRVGVLSFFEDVERERKFLMELMIECGYIRLKAGYKESLDIILKALEANEARGKRKYVRVRCDNLDNVGCNIKIGDKLYEGIIKDISSYGMAFYFKNNETFLRRDDFIDNIQLKLKGVLVFASGRIYDARPFGEKTVYVLIFQNLNYDEKDKIHEFIYKALQQEMQKEIEDLTTP